MWRLSLLASRGRPQAARPLSAVRLGSLFRLVFRRRVWMVSSPVAAPRALSTRLTAVLVLTVK